MSSISFGDNQAARGSLPGEIRLLILDALVQNGCTLSRLATVS